MENNQQSPQVLSAIQEEDKGMNLKTIIYIFLQNWLWFAAAVIVCLLLAFLYLRYTVPTYEISSKILIKDDKNGPSASSQDFLSQFDVFSSKHNVNDEKQILHTHYLVKQVVNALQLNVSYFTIGNIKSTELYSKRPFKVQVTSLIDSLPEQKLIFNFSGNNGLFTIKSNDINGKYGLGDTINTKNLSFVVQAFNANELKNNDYKVVITNPDAATDKYLKNLTIDITDKGANVIQVNLQETVPKKGEDILNKLYELYMHMNEEDKNKIADSTIHFIDERLAVVSNELSGVETNIQQYKEMNQLSTDIDEQAKLALNNASDIQQQLTTQDVQINVVQSIEDHLKGNSPRIVPNAGVIQDPTYITTVQQYNALVLERDRQLQTTKPDNPIVQNLNSQIEAVKSNLLTSLQNIKKEMQISKKELTNKNLQFLSQIKSGPAKERAILDISRQQNVKQQLYLYLLQKREETAISKSGTLANSRLIEPGRSNTAPLTPKNSLIYLVALCSGVLLPTSIIYLKNVLNDKVMDNSDITKVTYVPLLVEIGHNTGDKTIVAEQNSRSGLAEQFRTLRTNLQFLLKGKENQVIMVTSSTSGEGKSFLTMNLGSALAISDKKVVLVELDLRKPKLSNEIGLSRDIGITDYLISAFKVEEILKPTPVHPNLFLISSGTIPPNPAELLLHPKVGELFAWLKTKFDYIIVDTPPVGVVIDSVLIGKHADASIYVVRQKYTLKEQLQIINTLKQDEKLPNLSVILNDVKSNKTYGYKYGYSYGYGYTTSDYYSDDKKKKKFLQNKS